MDFWCLAKLYTILTGNDIGIAPLIPGRCNFKGILKFIVSSLTLWCLINLPQPAFYLIIIIPLGPYVDPLFINLEKFQFQQLQNIQKYTISKGYFD